MTVKAQATGWDSVHFCKHSPRSLLQQANVMCRRNYFKIIYSCKADTPNIKQREEKKAIHGIYTVS